MVFAYKRSSNRTAATQADYHTASAAPGQKGSNGVDTRRANGQLRENDHVVDHLPSPKLRENQRTLKGMFRWGTLDLGFAGFR